MIIALANLIKVRKRHYCTEMFDFCNRMQYTVNVRIVAYAQLAKHVLATKCHREGSIEATP